MTIQNQYYLNFKMGPKIEALQKKLKVTSNKEEADSNKVELTIPKTNNNYHE